MTRIWWAVVLGLLFANCALAAQGRELTRAEARRYDKLTHALIAPCCWREPIAIHRSDEALQMLDEVKRLVADGRSEEEIKAIYVARYGVRILADPPGTAGHWLYAVPVALLCSLLFLASVRLRSLVASVPRPIAGAPAELIAQVRLETEGEWN